MGHTTKAFRLFFKHMPSASLIESTDTPTQDEMGNDEWTKPLANTNAFDLGAYISTNPWTAADNKWYISGSDNSSPNVDTYDSWFGYPKEYTYGFLGTTRTWRSPSVSTPGFVTASYRALPWGSHACDFLWNVLVPSWSGAINSVEDNLDIPAGFAGIGKWYCKYATHSFHFDNWSGSEAGRGQRHYPLIVSSWHIYDPKMVPDSSGSTWPANSRHNWELDRFSYSGNSTPYQRWAGTYTNGNGRACVVLRSPYSESLAPQTIPSTIAFPIPTPGHFYTSCSYKLGDSTTRETSSIDNQPFYEGAGAAITRTEVSRSLVTASLFASSTSGAGLTNFRRGLKNRRLYFPVNGAYSGSGTTAADYWLNKFTGRRANEYFTENGGIYSVSFTLKRDLNADRYPDANTYMNVFIHRVMDDAPTPSNRSAGADGWYPPANNIVTIGNGYGSTPTMTFNDPVSGYKHERFTISVIQYGSVSCSLCFEPSGSLSLDQYFGIIVDDISFCKVGVTTDPNFIKPANISTSAGSITPESPAEEF